MNICVVGGLILISAILTLSDATVVKRSSGNDDCDEECRKTIKRKCYGKSDFDATTCTTLTFDQYAPCSYFCICNGTYHYYQDELLAKCGKRKYCIDSTCQNQVYADCGPGNNTVAIQDPYNQCQYRCYQRGQCGYTLNNLPCGESCSVDNVCETGRCNTGVCEFSQDGEYCACYGHRSSSEEDSK